MNTPNRKQADNSAATLLITIASIAAVITGWAIFANNDSSSQATTDIAAVPALVNTVAKIAPKPLPTIVPLSGVTPQATLVAPTGQPQAPTVQQPARIVNPAPQPLTRSRSSR